MSTSSYARIALTVAWLSVPRIGAAQSIRAADSLLSRGALARAESLYYSAVRARPRDPAARWALGRFLASRGAPRVASTLMEEAIQFGGDAHLIAPDLAQVYETLDEYRELVALGGAPLSVGERNRATWLLEHPTRTIAPDTMLLALYHESTSGDGYLGELPIRVDGRTLDAMIAPRVVGLVVADTNSIVQRLHRFASPEGALTRGRRSLAAAADSLAIGRLTLTNVPVTVAPIDGGHQAIIGLDLLARLAPTFDGYTNRLTLRPAGTVAASADSVTAFPTLLTRDDFRILRAGNWSSATSTSVQSLLSGHRWTFDARRGQLIVER